MNNYNNNSMNMNEQEEVPMLPPLFRSMNLMAVAPAPQLARETTDHSNKQPTNSIGKEERSSSCTRNVSPTSIVHTTPSTPTWAPVDALRKLSYYHPLDPSHVTVPRDDLTEVLDGVSAALRALSCHVTYASDALVATALTMDGVEFQIALWANRGNSKNSNNNKRNNETDIICEMQRIKGDSYTYHAHYAQPILRAVTAHDYSPFDGTNATNTRTNTCAGHALDQMQHMPGMTTTSTATDEDIMSALEMAGTMLLSDRYDACLLGMESLECLTQPTSVGWQTATVVAQGLTEESAVSNFLWNQLLHPTHAELQYAALKIWVQVWQILAELQHPQFVLPAEDTVVTLLLQMIQQAATAPHVATLAAQGLTALYQLEQPAVVQRLSYNVQEQQPIQYAAMIGQACHAALAAASGQLLTTVHG